MLRLMLASALTACYVPLANFTELECPAEYVHITGTPPDNRYRFAQLNREWDVNETDCENDSTVGTHLIIIDDTDESIAVVEYLQAMTGGFFVHAGYARNLADDGTTGFFKVTGEPFPVTRPPWGTNQPDSDGPITYFSLGTGIQDAPVSFMAWAMCECDLKPATKSFVIR
jgi:hypothetical protein